jgi:general secretion pathway protein D
MKPRVSYAVSLLVAVSSVLMPVTAVRSADNSSVSSSTAQPDSPPLGQEGSADAADLPVRFEELDLRDAPLRDALTLIGSTAGINLAASNDAAQATVTIHLKDVTADQAVQALCQTNGLYYRKPSNDEIGIVTTVKEFQEGLTVFRDENTRVFTLLYPNAMDLAVAVRDLYGDRVHLSLGKEGVYDDSDELSRRFESFDQLNQRGETISLNSSGGSGGSTSGGFGTIGGSSTSGGGSSFSGGGSSGLSSLSNLEGGGQANPTDQSVLQNLSPQELERISNLVKQQGAGIGVDTATLNSLGRRNASIYVTVINRNNQMIVRTSDPDVLDEIATLKKEIDVPTPQVLLEVKVLSVDLTDGFNSVFDYQYSGGDPSTSGNNTYGFSTGGGALGGPGEPAGSPFALNPTSLIYQYVNDHFQARIQLLESHNKVTELATPMLLVANNEVSQIFVGQQYPIIQNISSQTTATQGVVTSTPQTTFNFEPVGTTLLITPNINADRTVTLRLLEEQSSVIVDGASIPIVGSNGTVTNQPVDIVSATTLTGTLVAKDGLSLALGGLIDETLTNQNEQVPILGDLPYLGFLFRRQNIGRTRNEVIVVIRPYILSTPSEAQEASKRLTDATSLHPIAPDLYPADGQPIGTLNTFLPDEVQRPDQPRNKLETTFRFYDVLPTDY